MHGYLPCIKTQESTYKDVAGITGITILQTAGIGYYNILQEAIRLALNNLNQEEAAEARYQQDGAPPHNTRMVSDLLYTMFDDRWIANNGPHSWPARSPDLNPLDASIWGYIKGKVYQDPPTTKQNMRNRVLETSTLWIRCLFREQLVAI
ncbi:hypothetical protein NQ315_003623 [Exocentrus adspersus]|uniref:Uncharacterized protein n=1 Tax=Exocentrus adspersus TaxID=1586481 RepID=A0AAV8VJA9_9CUCU|nr:hypothetical protein NQ315_003623 [Exocentrus adspersus]